MGDTEWPSVTMLWAVAHPNVVPGPARTARQESLNTPRRITCCCCSPHTQAHSSSIASNRAAVSPRLPRQLEPRASDGRRRRQRRRQAVSAARLPRGRAAGQRPARPGLRVHPHHRARGRRPPRRHRDVLPALQGPQRRRVGTDRGGRGEHRRVHGVGVPAGRRRPALHQPRQGRAPRRPYPGAGQAHPGRPQHPGLGGPDMADRSFDIRVQRFGVNSKGYPNVQSINAR